MPKVSICIPAYNTAKYLPEAIESVLAQDFTDYELVICDNASTDETPEICRSYTDSRIRYVRFEELTNQSGNFNRCLNLAQSELIALLHADDYYLPGFISDRVARFENDTELGFIFGAVKTVDACGAELSVGGRWSEDRRFERGELIESLLFGCLVSPPSLMFRRRCAESAGKFREDITWGHDWEWTMRLAEKSSVCYTARPLASYRVHDGSGTAEILSAAKNGEQERQILLDTLARVSAENSKLASLRRPSLRALSLRHMYFAEQALMSERRSVARNNLWYAALADFGMTLRPTFWALALGSVMPVNWYLGYRSLRNKNAFSDTAL